MLIIVKRQYFMVQLWHSIHEVKWIKLLTIAKCSRIQYWTPIMPYLQHFISKLRLPFDIIERCHRDIINLREDQGCTTMTNACVDFFCFLHLEVVGHFAALLGTRFLNKCLGLISEC